MFPTSINMLKSYYILIGNYPPPFSGQSIAFKTLVDGFQKKAIFYKMIDTIEKDGKRWILFRIITYFKVFVKLFFFLTDKNSKIVYHIVSSSSSGFWRDFLIINLSFFFGKKIILHSHNGNYHLFYNSQTKYKKKIIKSTISKADKIILLSSNLRKTFGFITDSQKFQFICNGLPFNIEENESKIDNSIIDILYLSNLIESKGYLDLLNSAVLLNEANLISKYHFHFAGSFMLNPSQDKSYKTLKEAKDIFKKIIQKNNLEKFVTYHGVLKGDDKTALLKKADIFILPTYYDIEAQPITIIEAMAFKTPVFATKYRGIRDMIIPNQNGLFILPKCPVDIVKNLEKVSLPELRKMGEFSFNLYKEKFTKKSHLQKMLEVFKGLEYD